MQYRLDNIESVLALPQRLIKPCWIQNRKHLISIWANTLQEEACAQSRSALSSNNGGQNTSSTVQGCSEHSVLMLDVRWLHQTHAVIL